MDNMFFGKTEIDVKEQGSPLRLLAVGGNTEIMLQTIEPNSLVMITPAEDPEMLEFFYIIKGTVEIESQEGMKHLSEGDFFYLSNLKREHTLRNADTVRLLYVTTRPAFASAEKMSEDLHQVLRQISEKDQYTYGHSERVMDYAVKISKLLHLENTTMDNIAISAAFHDVGKCFMPDEILMKKEALTNEEYREIMKHPIHSRRMLEGKFGKVIGEIVETHHERNDGTGYPYGLAKEDIRMEAQIIAVADSFDAMTSKRIYSIPMPFEEAADELAQDTDRYDPKIVSALSKLIQDGEIASPKEKTPAEKS